MNRFILSILFLAMAFMGFCQNGQNVRLLSYIEGAQSYDEIGAITNYAILADGEFWNVSDPFNPVMVSSVDVNYCCTILPDDQENLVYFGGEMSGLFSIVDISNIYFPDLLSSIDFYPSMGIYGIARENDLLLLAINNLGLVSLDVSDKTAPILLDTLPIISGGYNLTRDVVLKDQIAYVAHTTGLKTVDATNPEEL